MRLNSRKRRRELCYRVVELLCESITVARRPELRRRLASGRDQDTLRIYRKNSVRCLLIFRRSALHLCLHLIQHLFLIKRTRRACGACHYFSPAADHRISKRVRHISGILRIRIYSPRLIRPCDHSDPIKKPKDLLMARTGFVRQVAPAVTRRQDLAAEDIILLNDKNLRARLQPKQLRRARETRCPAANYTNVISLTFHAIILHHMAKTSHNFLLQESLHTLSDLRHPAPAMSFNITNNSTNIRSCTLSPQQVSVANAHRSHQIGPRLL